MSHYVSQNQKAQKIYTLAQKFKENHLERKRELEHVIAAKKLESANYIESWRKSYEQIAKLPQLYIAA